MVRDWKKHLLPKERERIRKLDAAIAKGDARVRVLRDDRKRIQNRATARAKPGRKPNS